LIQCEVQKAEQSHTIYNASETLSNVSDIIKIYYLWFSSF